MSPQIGDAIYDSNITCGRLAYLSASKTETATVLAGSELGFRTWKEWTIVHPGPAQIYLTKVPDQKNIEEFVGDEEGVQWFKIASIAQESDTQWITYNKKEVSEFNVCDQ